MPKLMKPSELTLVIQELSTELPSWATLPLQLSRLEPVTSTATAHHSLGACATARTLQPEPGHTTPQAKVQLWATLVSAATGCDVFVLGVVLN